MAPCKRQIGRDDEVGLARPLVDDGPARRRRQRHSPTPRSARCPNSRPQLRRPQRSPQGPSTRTSCSRCLLNPIGLLPRKNRRRVSPAHGRFSRRSGRSWRRPRTMGAGRSGGIGRRAGLKIRFPPGSVGSIPTFGTFDVGVRRQGTALQNLICPSGSVGSIPTFGTFGRAAHPERIRRGRVREPRGRRARRASAARTPRACRAAASARSRPARP